MADKQSREENQCIHCGKPYREESSKPLFRKVCCECKCYRVSGSTLFIRNRILERNMNYCKPLTPYQIDEVVELYKEYVESSNITEVNYNIDAKELIKALKATQRDTRKVIKNLRQLERMNSYG